MNMSEETNNRTTKLNISLIKKNITDIREIVVKKHHPLIKEISLSKCDSAYFVYKEPAPSKPDWYQYLDDLSSKLPDTQTNPSALILLELENHYFAVTFGHGRYIVDDRVIEPDFGIKVCLNTIPSNKIKTVDTRNLDQMAIHTRQQAIVPVDFNTFELEIDRDLLKTIDGHIDGNLGSYLKGSSTLAIVTKKPINELSELCFELYRAYKKKAYLKEFAWIDNVKLVHDVSLIESLNNKLLQLLRDKIFEGIFLGSPEIIDDSNIGSFKFRGPRNGSNYIIFPSIENYVATRNECNHDDPIEIEHILGDQILAFNRDDPPSLQDHWSIFKCLHAEISFNLKVYKLLDGNWYEIDGNYLSRIDNEVQSIQYFRTSLPDMNVSDSENDYNNKLANYLKGVCLDGKCIELRGRSKFEFCDVFTEKRKLLHIKKHTGAPSISHLLNQAYVSGHIFIQHKQAREVLADFDCIKNTSFALHVNPKSFHTSDYEIVIGVASTKSKPVHEVLSFFSKICLVHNYRALTNLGYQVTVASIHIT